MASLRSTERRGVGGWGVGKGGMGKERGEEKRKKKRKALAILSKPINVGDCSIFRQMSESWSILAT